MASLAALVSLVILAATGSEALICYACVPRHQIAGVSLPPAIANKTINFPRCDELQPSAPERRFRMTCPAGLDRSCIKIRDDSGNEMRSCFSAVAGRCTKTSKLGQVLCMCQHDFCNAAVAAAPGARLVASALTVGLLLARR